MELLITGLFFVAVATLFTRGFRREDDARTTGAGLAALGFFVVCLFFAITPVSLVRCSPHPRFDAVALMAAVAAYAPTSLLRGGLAPLRLLPVAALWFVLIGLASENADDYRVYGSVWWLIDVGTWGALLAPPLLGCATLLAEYRRRRRDVRECASQPKVL